MRLESCSALYREADLLSAYGEHKAAAELREAAEAVERYIDGLADSKLRRICRARYCYGWTWQKIAFASGCTSEAAPRLYVRRHLPRP